MDYLKLANYYEETASTTKRLEKTDITAGFLNNLKEEDKDVLYLLVGDIYPEYDERKIGISTQLAIKAISKATGSTEKKVISEWKKIGDLGEVSFKLTKTKKQSTLDSHIISTKKVLDDLRKLPELEGKGTVAKKISIITGILTSATPIEAKYLVRTLIGDLRIGVQESTIRESLAKAFFSGIDNISEIVQRAIDKSNDLAIVFELCHKKDIKHLEKLTLHVGKPIKAMLAQKAKSMEAGFKELGTPCIVEYKYDGFRLLIHKIENEVTLFTRRLENVTKQFPEVKEYVEKYIEGKSFILDSEAVGFDKKTGQYTDFQAISQRIRRKHNIANLQKKLPVEINVFDILYYNGKSQLDEPLRKRSELLREIVTNKKHKLVTSKQIITSDIKVANKFYHKALKDNQEGVMLKSMNAEYKPGRRVGHMLKIKPDERDLDLVITGAEYGTGKRRGWMSSFILSCRHGNKYLEIGKVGTGIKEKSEDGLTFEELTKTLKPLIIKEKGRNVTVSPKVIVAIHYQDIQKSTNYNSGYALRFPRVTALRTNDKHLSEISSLSEIEGDFTHQKNENYTYG